MTMSTVMNLNPKNMMMLAAIGIGAYWLTTRQARASNSPQGASRSFFQSPAVASRSPGAQPNLGAGLFAALTTFIGGSKPAGTVEINNTALPGGAGWGWQYFSDGTTISPEGVYYKNGSQIWSPSGADAVAANSPNSYSSGASGGWDTESINGMY